MISPKEMNRECLKFQKITCLHFLKHFQLNDLSIGLLEMKMNLPTFTTPNN